MRVRAAATAVLAVFLAACNPAGGAELEETDASERVRTINVEVLEVQPEDFTHFVRVVGTVEAERDVVVAAEEGGVVEALLVRKGERVRPGQPLFRLDGDILTAELDQAVAQAALAEETWQRQKRLWEQDQIGTEMAYLQARYEAERANAHARALRERVERTTVRSPIAGILDDRMVEVGSMVSPGTPVARVLDLDTVKVVSGVPERYAAEIDRGSEVAVTVDALNGRTFAGQVDFVGSAVAGDNRTFTIEIEVANAGLGIKPGMVADVQVARLQITDALAVPRHAVIRREAGYVVFVANRTADGWRAESRTVVPGVTRGSHIVIDEGLEPGERVVTVGQQQVANGDALNLTNERGAASAVEAAGTPEDQNDEASVDTDPGEDEDSQ